MPPSVNELENRLRKRATDSEENIQRRIAKAEEELTYAPKYDTVIINDNLETALKDAVKIIEDFLNS